MAEHPSPTPKAAAVEQNPGVTIVTSDDTERWIRKNANIKLEDMPSEFHLGRQLDLPIVFGMKKIRTPKGGIVEVPCTIQDTNPQFTYKWCDREHLDNDPNWSNHAIVHRDNPAGNGMPEREWNTNGVVQRGPMFLVYCLAKYSASEKASYRNMAERRLQQLMPRTVSKDSTGAGIEITKFEATEVDPGEPLISKERSK